MRTIKFRFWDKDLKKMFFRHPAKMDFSHPNIIPMQFTGLTDKNGKEIYEEDILGEPVNIDGKEKMSAWPVVWFDKKGIWAVDVSFKKDGKYLIPLHGEIESMEIVGNIHENPELL